MKKSTLILSIIAGFWLLGFILTFLFKIKTAVFILPICLVVGILYFSYITLQGFGAINQEKQNETNERKPSSETETCNKETCSCRNKSNKSGK